MVAQRRKFQRPLGERRYKKLFLIAAEGIKTEPIYFGLFNTTTKQSTRGKSVRHKSTMRFVGQGNAIIRRVKIGRKILDRQRCIV